MQKKIANVREEESAMWIAPFGHVLRPWLKKASARAHVTVAEARAVRPGDRERPGVPRHERLLLASLLLVVICWTITKLLLSLLAAK
jgi:hypothetical protein